MRVMVIVQADEKSEAGDSVMEIRPIFEADDQGENFTPELREQEERLRARSAANG